MKRIMLLVLVALALPTAALANSFDFSTGNFVSGTFSGMFATGHTVDVSVVGSLNTIGIVTGTMTQFFCPGATCFMFSGGTVTVGPGGSLLMNGLSTGLITRMGGDVAIAAILAPSAMANSGSASFAFHFTGTTLTSGVAGVHGQSTVPEPGTLEGLLLGMGVLGLIGLAGVTRRKRAVTPHLATCC